MPLTMKIEMPPPPPPGAGAGGGGGAMASPGTPGPIHGSGTTAPVSGGAPALPGSPDVHQKENYRNDYADRVRNSPGFRRRYGHRTEYRNQYSNIKPQHQVHHPPQPPPKQRLPLPKNAVLLSLIQASEPARRRAEVEAPPTPQKTEDKSSRSLLGGGGRSETPSPGNRQSTGIGNSSSNSSMKNNNALMPKFSRPSPLFLDGSSSGDAHESSTGIVGSMPDDEEHKIRVGTYLEGGPCGTYAVAAKAGLLVYPTLFERTLPSALNGLKQEQEDEEDLVKRDVDELVKRHRASAGRRMFPSNNNRNKHKNKSATSSIPAPNTHNPALPSPGGVDGILDTEIGVSHTWVECHQRDDDPNNFEVEAHCAAVEVGSSASVTMTTPVGGEDNVSPLISPAGADIPIMSMSESDTSDKEDGDNDSGASGGEKRTVMSDPGTNTTRSVVGELGSLLTLDKILSTVTANISSSPRGADDDEDEDVIGLGVSLTISDDDEDESDNKNVAGIEGSTFKDISIDRSTRTLPARRTQSTQIPSPSTAPTSKDDAAGTITKKFVRHFSHGSSLYTKLQKKKGATTGEKDGEHDKGDEDMMENEFDRPLIRLKYGDRVQVVSMDSRGWVKLARGYGYIRLENDKQLVKVGGTSDRACQIEAMLHELSIERNRLKTEQTKLERLSAGLMIDLQSSLITSDDNVVVPAPEGSLQRNDSDNISPFGSNRPIDSCVDDIDVSTRSRTVLTPPRIDQSGGNSPPSSTKHREIRTAKSHSPGRTTTPTGNTSKTPPSPPYGQVTPNTITGAYSNWSNVNTPTRVNFRTGLSGHRALTSSHSHPHDFIGGGTLRSMSNHAGISSSKKSNSRGRSIY